MKKGRIFIFAALFGALFISGCNRGGSVNAPAGSAPPAGETKPATAVKQTTPTEAFQKYIEAYDRRDINAMKQTYSVDTIKMYEEIARQRQVPVEEVIKGQFEAPFAENASSKVSVVGEKVENESTASVEVKSEGVAENERIPMVRENGEWKLALNKYVEEIQRRMTEDMKKMSENPGASVDSESDNKPNKK